MNKKFSLTFKSLIVFILFGLLIAFVGGCAEPVDEEVDEEEVIEVETIKAAIVNPMGYSQGEHSWNAAMLARDEINEQGGIMVGDTAMQLELVQIDTNEIESVPDAVSAVERAITMEEADFLVGGFRSEAVLAYQETAMDYETIFIASSVGTPELTQRVAEDYDNFKYFFRVQTPNSNDMGRAIFAQLGYVAGVLREDYGIETPKVAVMIERTAFAEPMYAAATQLIPDMGMEIVGEWRPSATADDLRSELTAIDDAEADIIFKVFSTVGGIVYTRQWNELEVPAVSVGINPEAQTLDFWDATGGNAEYEMTLSNYVRVPITEKTIPFIDKYVDTYGDLPLFSAASYDALYIMKEAIERAGSLDNDLLVEELKNTDYEGTYGRIAFDENHDLIWGPGYVTMVGVQWIDGELECVWPWEWEDITYDNTIRYQVPPWVDERLSQ